MCIALRFLNEGWQKLQKMNIQAPPSELVYYKTIFLKDGTYLGHQHSDTACATLFCT